MRFMMCMSFIIVLFACFQMAFAGGPDQNDEWRIHSWERPRPPVVESATASTQEEPGRPPSDAIVLFDGGNLSKWVSQDGSEPKWNLEKNYVETVQGAGYIRTIQGFGDCQLHLEFMTPSPPQGQSQGRGNSGVFLMGIYEVQVLDSYKNKTYADGQCSSIYGQYPPQVNSSRPPGEWQTYDIIFKAPQFNDEKELVKPAYITVFQNGVLTQNHVKILGPTSWCSRTPYNWSPEKLPLALQDHGNPVRFRNIWVRELPATGEPDGYRKELYWGDVVLDKYSGTYESDNGSKVVMIKKGRLLYPSFPGSGEHPIFAESKTRFYQKFVNAEYEFVVDDDGNPTGLKVNVTSGGWSEYKKID